MTQEVLDSLPLTTTDTRRIEVAPRVDVPVKGGLEGVDQLLRRPAWFVEAATRSTAPATLVRSLLLTVLAGAGLFGASMGLFRPGPQILSSAVKLPLVLLFTAALTAPAYAATRWAQGAKLDLRQDILLFLSTLGLTSLVLAALAPVVLLGVLSGLAYHGTILTVVACSAVAGLVGIGAFVRAARRLDGSTRLAALVAAGVFAVVGMQMAWTLRPFVARPRAAFELVRAPEGSFVDSVSTSARSAQGDYSREAAPLPGDVSQTGGRW